MVTGTLLFVLGVLLFQWQSELPSIIWVFLSPLSFCLLLVYRRGIYLLLPCMGFILALAHAHLLLLGGLTPDLEGKDLDIQGVVIGLPDIKPERTRFEFMVERVELDGVEQDSPGKIRLGWYRTAPRLEAGERWQLQVRLKRPRGLMNPGGFDYEGWLFQNRIRATGYVRTNSNNRRLHGDSSFFSIHELRQEIRDRINSSVSNPLGAAMLNALLIGDRSSLGPDQWELFSATGTSHLVAISGLHIGIVAGLVFLISRRAWSCSQTLLLLLPAAHAGSIFALVMACVYAALAGFAIPTQRALIMLLVFTLAFLRRMQVGHLHSLSVAMFLVVLIDPMSVLSAGFWLSFMAVAGILYGTSNRVGNAGWVSQWGKVQWLVALVLAPVLLMHGLQVSIIAPAVNLIAVPLFSFLIVPMAMASVLLSLLIEPVGVYLMQKTAWILVTFMEGLDFMSNHALMTWSTSDVPFWAFPLAILGMFIVLAPGGIPGRWLGAVLIVPALVLKPQAPEHGAVKVVVLDVGQGLSVVVRTSQHLLVYDLGPGFSSGFNTGSSVVLPYLRHEAVSRIDRLILSNGDLDHAGGLPGIIDDIEIGKIVSAEPKRLGVKAKECIEGHSWSWDSITFRYLHPGKDENWRGNNRSCVLMIEVGERKILLSGDIERKVEEHLATGFHESLKSDLVLVPHHGSKSSSTPGFVALTSPKYAVAATGYRNRYGFPFFEVKQRWEDAGAQFINTANTGAVEFLFAADGSISGPVFQRLRGKRYWHMD